MKSFFSRKQIFSNSSVLKPGQKKKKVQGFSMEQVFAKNSSMLLIFFYIITGKDYARKPCSILGYPFSCLHTFH